MQLERALGAPADFWLTRESHYREWLSRQRSNEDLARWASWLKELPLPEMRSFGWIKTTDDQVETVAACLQFFGVATVEAWREMYERPLAAFRASDKVKQKKGAVAAWLRRGEIAALRVECDPFDERGFRTRLGVIRALTQEPDPDTFVPELMSLCQSVGVAVVFVRAPAGYPASGAARWLSPNKALIQLSLRYKTNDQLQREKIVPWSHFNHLKIRYSWARREPAVR